MIKKGRLIVLLAIFLSFTLSSCFKCELGQIEKQNVCVDCRDILFTKKVYLSTALHSDHCQCEQGYQWSYTLRECVDDLKKSIRIMQTCNNNQIILNGNCFNCPGASQYGTGVASVGSCTCLANFQWVTTPSSGSCSPLCNQQKGFISYSQGYISSTSPKLCTNCRLIPFGLGANINAGSCACNPAFAYQPSFYSCYCYLPSYIEPINNKCVPCAQAGSTLVAQCKTCSAPFRASLSGCYYAPGIPNGSSGTSSCVTGYIFHFYRGKCICDVSKRYSIGSNGVCTLFTTANADGYYCTRSFVYDKYQCKHGSLIPNYDYTTTYACKAGFVFKSDRFTQKIISCACSAAALNYVNGASCLPCSGSLPSGVIQSSCTSCSKSAGFYKGEVECIYCPGVTNAVGTATLDGCDCATNYFWNTDTSKCQCDYVLGFIPGSTANTCINCQNIANTDSTMFPDSCSCLTGYKWNPSTKTCDCDTSSPNIFLQNGVCVNCALMEGSTGVSDANGACQCMNSFYWNPALSKCVCDFNQNYVVFSNGLCTDCIFAKFSNGLANSFGCVCISGLVWDRTTAKCICPSGNVMIGTTCTSCSASGILPSGAVASDCNACANAKGFALDSIGCYLCSSQTGASSTVTSGKCTCTASSSQAWIPHLGSCVCDWGKTYATKLLSTGSFSCVLCPYKTSTGVCDCQGSYNQLLDVDYNICSDRVYDSNFNYPYSKCNNGFIWSQATYPFRCVPQGEYYGYLSLANNASVVCSSSANSAKCSLCDVNSGYLLAFGIHRCLLCSTITGATGLAKINQCPCSASGSTWNQVTFKCDASNCGPALKYNPSKKICECDPVLSISVGGNCISCASISKSNGYAASSTSCGCISGVSWISSATGGSCGTSTCNANTQITLSTGVCFTCPTTNGPGTASGANCNCNTNYVWDSVTKTCICGSTKAITYQGKCIACNTIAQSTGAVLNPTTCICSSAFVWLNGACVCNPSTQITLSNGTCFTCPSSANYGAGAANSNNTCKCSLSFVWTPSSTGGVCSCSLPNSFIFNGACAVCSSDPFSSGVIAANGTCLCKAGYYWTVTATKASCLPCEALPNFIRLANQTCYICGGNNTFTTAKVVSAQNNTCSCNISTLQWDSRGFCDCGPTSVLILSANSYTCYVCNNPAAFTSTKIDSYTCSCTSTALQWNPSTKSCNSCSDGKIMIGTGASASCYTCPTQNYVVGASADQTRCICIGNLVWSSSSKSCGCPSGQVIIGVDQSTKCIACSSITYAVQQAGSSTCSCYGTGLVFSPLNGGSCSCPSNNIISPIFTCVACPAGTTKLTPYQCRCPYGLFWSYTRLTCLKCGVDIANSQSGKSTSIACFCNSGFIWDVMTQTCISASSCSVVAPSCMKCSAGSAITLNTATARGLTGKEIIEASINGPFTNYNKIKIYQCQCNPSVSQDPYRLMCFSSIM